MPSIALEGAKSLGKVYCTLCTRTVDAQITTQPNTGSREAGRRVTYGQRCPRCSALLDAAFVVSS